MRLPDGAFTGGSVGRLQGLDQLTRDFSGQRILDVGSGPGIVAEHLLGRLLCSITLIEGPQPSILDAKRAVVIHQNFRDVGSSPMRRHPRSTR